MPVQSAFIGWKQEPDEYLEEILGKDRASTLNPLRTFIDNGIVLSADSIYHMGNLCGIPKCRLFSSKLKRLTKRKITLLKLTY